MGNPQGALSAKKSSEPFWTLPLEAVLAELTSSAQGLAANEAAGRLATFGPNTDAPLARPRRSPQSPVVF